MGLGSHIPHIPHVPLGAGSRHPLCRVLHHDEVGHEVTAPARGGTPGVQCSLGYARERYVGAGNYSVEHEVLL